MITTIHNENFGYSVTVDDTWAAVGNPNILPFDATDLSNIKTGSVQVFKYNINNDSHDLLATLYRPITNYEVAFITTEQTNIAPTGPLYILETESPGNMIETAGLEILLDTGLYFTASADGYGVAIDVYDNILAVGDPYFVSFINVSTASFEYTSSGTVDIFDLSILEEQPYANLPAANVINYTYTPTISASVFVPGGQGYAYVSLLYSTTNPTGSYQEAARTEVTSIGGIYSIDSLLTTSSFSPLYLKVQAYVAVNPFVLSLTNPNPAATQSFGTSVSINSEWLAVGSLYESGSKGSVFMYRNTSSLDNAWFLYQTIAPPVGIGSGDGFGYSLSLNKATGSFSGSLVVGSLKASSSKAYIYDFDGASWDLRYVLSPDNQTVYPLTFFPYDPLISGSYPNTMDNFGHSVSIYATSVMVGAPTDRLFYEYSGSSVYQQGAVYFFELCPNTSSGYVIVRKSYGNEETPHNNLLGVSVSIYNDYAVAGCPKVDLDTTTWKPINNICYLRGSLYQLHYCNEDSEDEVNGQFILFNKTGSTNPVGIDWDIVNVYQTKKRFLNPYNTYGYAVDIYDNFINIGAPMLISGSDRIMDFTPGSSSFTGSVTDVGQLSGHAYIYNLNNLKNQFYVGNVFYRNGKIVISTSGSIFDSILTTDINETEYDINFTSTQTIYEKQVVCSVEPGEFNVSTNPTAINLPTSSWDINENGRFDFQDVDILLRYMMYKNTVQTNNPTTDWSSSIVNTQTNEESTVYNMYASTWNGTDSLFTQSFSYIDNNLYKQLDLNNDNKMNSDDMNILWKYFIYRLTQKNYESWITPNSTNQYLSDIIDYINSYTKRGFPPTIKGNFLDYSVLATADPTGSYLAPFVTTIGLYSGANLVAVAKLGSPIKLIPDFPFNFIVKMDF